MNLCHGVCFQAASTALNHLVIGYCSPLVATMFQIKSFSKPDGFYSSVTATTNVNESSKNFVPSSTLRTFTNKSPKLNS